MRSRWVNGGGRSREEGGGKSHQKETSVKQPTETMNKIYF